MGDLIVYFTAVLFVQSVCHVCIRVSSFSMYLASFVCNTEIVEDYQALC